MNGWRRLGCAPLRDRQVDRLRSGELDVGPGGVEVGVVGEHPARTADDGEEDLLGRPPLVGGQHVPEREELGDGVAEAVEGRRACVRLVAALDAGPLLGGHGACPRVGQQIHQDVVGVDPEEVMTGVLQVPGPLLAGRHPHRLHGVHAEGLDDGPEAGVRHADKLVDKRVALLGRESRRQLGVTDLVARQGPVWTTP